MKGLSILSALFFCFSSVFCVQCERDALSPSIIGEVYAKLSKAHLVGRILSCPDIKKAKKIIGISQLKEKDWVQQVKPFELDLLFQLGIVLAEIGDKDLAAQMIWVSYANGNKDNCVVKALKEVVTKDRIVDVLSNMGL